jgi:hypothetical protein
MDQLEAMVFQVLGQASMCWSEKPGGVFDSEQAMRIGYTLINAMVQHEQEAIAKAQAAWHLSHPTIIRDANGQIIAQSKGLCG